MSNTPEMQEQNIQPIGGRQLIISGRQTMIELNPEELNAVVGGKPVIEITISPDGTIKIVQK